MLLFNKRFKNIKALTYIEIMLGIMIILFVFIGINSVFGVGIRNNKKTENLYLALGLSQALMEEIKAKDFNNIVNVPQSNINGFLRSANIVPNYNGNISRKLVSVTVSGPDISEVKLDCIVCNT